MSRSKDPKYNHSVKRNSVLLLICLSLCLTILACIIPAAAPTTPFIPPSVLTFDKVYNLASLTSAPLTDVQTTLVPPGGATVVEFKLEVPGRYILVDHALSRMERGLAGYLIAEGADNPDVFYSTEPPSAASGH